MTNLDTSQVSINVDEGGKLIIEKFAEEISDKLMINETYFGNLISVLSDLFLLLLENQLNTDIRISYSTDYQSIRIIITGVSRETSLLINSLTDNIDKDIEAKLFTIHNLTDDILMEDNKLTLTFNVEAINRDVYNERKKLLLDYFQGNKFEKIINSHDQF